MKNKEEKEYRIEITSKSLINLILIALALLFFYKIRNVLAITFVALIISAAVTPMINRLMKANISKGIATTISFIVIIVVIFTLIFSVAVPLVRELFTFAQNSGSLTNTFVNFVNSFGHKLGISNDLLSAAEVTKNITNYFSGFTNNLGKIINTGASGIITLFGGLLTIIITFVLAVYLTLYKDYLVNLLIVNVPNHEQKDVAKLIDKIYIKLGHWLNGQILLSLVIGLLSWLMYTILGIEYALPLALLAALFDMVPTLGPIFALFPALIVALATGGPVQWIGIPIGTIIIHQLESHLIAPKILSTAIGLTPIAVIFAILIGGELAGPIGVLLAVPVAGLIQLGFEFWRGLKAEIKD